MKNVFNSYTKFPYRVSFRRTSDWWTTGWREISSWLAITVGPCATHWEYLGEQFMFTKEEHKTLFLLRWGQDDN
jgi:hypothetical protein